MDVTHIWMALWSPHPSLERRVLQSVLITPAALLPTRGSCMKYLSTMFYSIRMAREADSTAPHREFASVEDKTKLSPSNPLSLSPTLTHIVIKCFPFIPPSPSYLSFTNTLAHSAVLF